MIEKAQSIESLEELGLSEQAHKYLTRKFSTLEEVIWYGRTVFFEGIKEATHTTFYEKVARDLAKSLDKFGFIRHDITPSSFRTNKIYRRVYGDVIAEAFPLFAELGNSGYVSFQNPSPEFVLEVKKALAKNLTNEEYKIFTLRFGFTDNKKGYTQISVGNQYCLSPQRVSQIEEKVAKKIKSQCILPPIEYSNTDYEEKVEHVVADIAKLYTELFEVSRLPFKGAREYFKNNLLFSGLDIRYLQISTRVYGVLKRSNIHTISDILKLPNDKWSEIPYFGSKAADELVEKMHAAGYVNFYICLDLS